MPDTLLPRPHDQTIPCICLCACRNMYSGATTAPSSPSLSSLAPGRPPTQPLGMDKDLVSIRPGGMLRRRVTSRPASAVGGGLMNQYHERRPNRGGLSTGGYTSGATDTPSSLYQAPLPSTDEASRLFRLQFPHLAIPNPYNTSGPYSSSNASR